MTGLSVCIVNYQGERYLPATLEAVARIEAPVREVLLVDNASTDRSVAITRQMSPGTRILELGVNRGPGTARNAGFERAVSDWILFVDNDVRPEPGAPGELQRVLMSHADAVAATPRIEYQDRPGVVQYAGAAAHVLGLQILRHADRPAELIPREVHDQHSLISACVLVHRERWGASPPFDEDFFLYLEDHEFGLRARLRGQRLLVVPTVRCLHGVGTEGVSIRASGEYSDVRIRHTIQNRWQVLIKLFEGRTLALLCPSLLLFEILQLAGVIRRGWVGRWLAAVRWTVRNLPALLEKRSEVQGERERADVTLLSADPIPFNPALLESRLEHIVRRGLDEVTALNWRVVRRLSRDPGN